MILERIWRSRAPAALLARTAAAPLEILFRAAVRLRSELYDRGLLSVNQTALPVLSVGNLSVGGAGKTPIAAWLAGELVAAGAAPAILLRGYGGDEQEVHRVLNPNLPVVAMADRVLGVQLAAAQGADIVVVDDGFQHRRLARAEDIVVVAAESTAVRRMLPAGEFREPFDAMKRATLILISRKSASDADVARSLMLSERAAPEVPRAVVRLDLGDMVSVGGEIREAPMPGRLSVLAICGIGDGTSFLEQLRRTGAALSSRSYPDHHRFTAADASALASEAESFDGAVCTLKDAVKLGRLWPADGPSLWYVSQRVAVESGQGNIGAALERILSARNPKQLGR